jgi:hypothetical protein
MEIANFKRGVLYATAIFLLTITAVVHAAPKTWFVDEGKLPFDPLPGATNMWGVHAGASYLIEVPDNWNGDLVLYAHGFRGEGPELTVGPPRIRAHLIANGYAWASSSYRANNYMPAVGAQDTHRLAKKFGSLVGKPNRVFLTGDSMGGHVIGHALEQWPKDFDGATPRCGVMGDSDLFDYFQDAYLASQTLAYGSAEIPTPADYVPDGANATKAALGPVYPFVLNESGEQFKSIIQNLTGGERPTFEEGWTFSNFGGNFVIDNGATGDGRDNIDTVYRFDTATGPLSDEEEAFNDMIARIESDPQFRRANGNGIIPGSRAAVNSPKINGTFTVPVLTLHTIGELFVPFHMEQIYARRAAANGNSHLLVQRAIRDVFHCNFTGEEMVRAFDDMVEWVDTGIRPGGDDILNPEVVADPSFGCEYTEGASFARGFIPACP